MPKLGAFSARALKDSYSEPFRFDLGPKLFSLIWRCAEAVTYIKYPSHVSSVMIRYEPGTFLGYSSSTKAKQATADSESPSPGLHLLLELPLFSS